jgi:hypothetical protein
MARDDNIDPNAKEFLGQLDAAAAQRELRESSP